ncbi:Hypothetical protein, putative [Bodo saltans]|uniref:Uncharacterized protein n=1 Tax=Bodo saltans TaxID=75058 RepID=A0A0S4JHJ6_BODSA|nr:Hypothetical protein, putative [Bodo saltans]|eukprot:CUG89823.1 Hypothetical protein, putative [Bodo saltans]
MGPMLRASQFKSRKLVNKAQLLMTRRAPFMPFTTERHEIQNQIKLEAFEKQCEDGVMFVAEQAVPSWRKSIKTNVESQKGIVKNMRGLRVRAVNGADEPGFPTHFR